MKRLGLVIALACSILLLAYGFSVAADDSKVKDATSQVESGAKKIPDGKGRGRCRGNGERHRQDRFRGSEVQRRKAEGGG